MIFKAWERCRFSRSNLKLKPLSDNNDEKGQMAPQGCFSVHVGPERQRFVVKTKYANHPLFQMLLEEAEEEYGFESDGPIWLPCNVDLFYKVLAEMDGEEEEEGNNNVIVTVTKVFPFFVIRSPAPLLRYLKKDHAEYSVMDSELLRINRFK
ncbi:hypothetical protein Fmac_001069 [Flemingia macrophylla]|uniref:Small auxin up regulated protein n=1 Tax=Flemingia macrophylla TaxID=520843 RepID=A0ABD1NG43_9FABA